MTNGERIKEMSPEEIRDLLFTDLCTICEYETDTDCHNEMDCRAAVLKWLNKEAQNEQ